MQTLFLFQLFLAWFAWRRGWRVGLACWMALPWSIVVVERHAPDLLAHLPGAMTLAGLSLVLGGISVVGMSWIAVANPDGQ